MSVLPRTLRKKPNEAARCPGSTPEQLRFPPVAGLSVRGDFDGGTLSSDFGPLILGSISVSV
jgi:hypothetical protein